MRKILLILFAFLFFVSSCERLNAVTDTNNIRSYIDESFNEDNGYVDVSEFYYGHNFKEIKDIKSVKIFVSTESSNFDEIGLFEFNSEQSAKRSVKAIKNYIDNSANNFKNGIIYDINEYPKFENASVIRNENVVIYMILDKEKSESIINLMKK